MGSPGLVVFGALLVLACASARAFGLPPRVEGDIFSKVQQQSEGSHTPGSGEEDTPKVPVCGEQAGDTVTRSGGKLLKLDGKNGLQFKCGKKEILAPPTVSQDSTRFTSVYEIKEDNSCNLDAGAKLLDSVVPGATLTQSTEQTGSDTRSQGGKGGAGEQVYTLNYTNGPVEERSLCYTCNTPSVQPLPFQSGQGQVSCTVFIKVPARPQSPNTDTSTLPPSPTSDAPAIAACVIGVALAFLGVVLHL